MSEDLERIKKAFLNNTPKIIHPKNSKEPTPFSTKVLLISISSLALLSFILNLPSPKEKPLKTQNFSTLNPTHLPQEIDSILTVDGKGVIKPLGESLPLTLENTSAKSLIINFNPPLNLYQKNVKIYFENPLKDVKLIVKDNSYCSNSLHPVSMNTNSENILEINLDSLAIDSYSLNAYRIIQLRLEIAEPASMKQKIKDIKVITKK